MSKKLEHNALPDLDELRRFHCGELPADRMREIQAIAAENPLLKECIEGYETTGVFMALPLFESTGLSAMGSVSATQAASSGTGTWFGISKTFITAVTSVKVVVTIITASIVGVIYLYSTHRADDQPAVAAYPDIDPNIQTNNGIVGDTANFVEDPRSVSDTNLVLPAASNLAQSASSNIPRNLDPNHTPRVIPNGLPSIPNDLSINAQNGTGQQLAGQQLRGSLVGVGMTSILNYRVADYSDYRKPKWSNRVFSEGHTPANQENKTTQTDKPQSVGLTYMEYLEECLGYFDNKQYKQAKEGFDQLRTNYPEDVNAQFYGAMTHYHLGQYELAIALFELTESNVLRSFREEAKFYRAMALKRLNRTPEWNTLMNEIATSGGFYAGQANKELQ
jgi:hypothetical protein